MNNIFCILFGHKLEECFVSTMILQNLVVGKVY